MTLTFIHSESQTLARSHVVSREYEAAIEIYKGTFDLLKERLTINTNAVKDSKCIKYEMLFLKLEIALLESKLGLKAMSKEVMRKSMQALKEAVILGKELQMECETAGLKLNSLDLLYKNTKDPIFKKLQDTFVNVGKNKEKYLGEVAARKAKILKESVTTPLSLPAIQKYAVSRAESPEKYEQSPKLPPRKHIILPPLKMPKKPEPGTQSKAYHNESRVFGTKVSHGFSSPALLPMQRGCRSFPQNAAMKENVSFSEESCTGANRIVS